MLNDQLQIALKEFLHVGVALILIIAAISVITGFIKEYIPQEKLQKKLKKQSTVKGAFMGASLGVLTPFCSASMVPVAMGMIQMSAPFSTVLPFLISAPLCNFVVVGIILATFGYKVACFYFLWTFFCAVLAGLTIGRSKIKNQLKDLSVINSNKTKKKFSCCEATQLEQSCCETDIPINSCSGSNEITTNKNEKQKNALNFAWALFKKIAPYAILGAAISGIALAYVPKDLVVKYVGDDSWYAIPVAATIGVPLYLRIEMVIPLLNTLLIKGMSMGAAIALLIGGTGASIPELAILSSMLKPKGILVFTLTVLAIAMFGGVLFMFI